MGGRYREKQESAEFILCDVFVCVQVEVRWLAGGWRQSSVNQQVLCLNVQVMKTVQHVGLRVR